MKTIVRSLVVCMYVCIATPVHSMLTKAFSGINRLEIDNDLGPIAISRSDRPIADDIVVEYDQPDPSKVKITIEKSDDGALRCFAKAIADSNVDPRVAMMLGNVFAPAMIGTISTRGRIIINGVTISGGQQIPQTKFNILVNPSAQLRKIHARSTNDSITFNKLIAAAIQAKGTNGNIKASLLEGNTSLGTTNGNISIDLSERCKTVNANTTNGSIRIRKSGFLGSLSAGTTNGSISYYDEDVENPFYKTFNRYEENSIDANTTNGNISFE